MISEEQRHGYEVSPGRHYVAKKWGTPMDTWIAVKANRISAISNGDLLFLNDIRVEAIFI